MVRSQRLFQKQTNSSTKIQVHPDLKITYDGRISEEVYHTPQVTNNGTPIMPLTAAVETEDEYNGAALQATVVAAPNPAGEAVTFYIRLSEKFRKAIFLEVFDLNGNAVLRKMLAAETTYVNWDCSEIPSGTYQYRIQISGRQPITNHLLIVR